MNKHPSKPYGLVTALGLCAALSFSGNAALAHDTHSAHQHAGLSAQAAGAAAQAAAADHTQALIALSKQWQNAQGVAKAQALSRLIAKAEERADLLAELIQSDPAAVLRVAIPEERQIGMPSEVLEMLEQRLELEGELEVIYEDNFEDITQSRLRQFLNTPFGERFELHFKDKALVALSGKEVRVNGLLFGNLEDSTDNNGDIALASDDLLILGADGSNNEGTSGPLPNTFGERRVAVMMVNFQDNPNDKPWTATQANSLMFGQINDFYQENSYNQAWLGGDVLGWYTLPLNGATTCPSNYDDAADAAAAAAGVDLSAYDHLVYMVPPSSACSGNWGTVGGSPSRSWITAGLDFRIITHELGHNFGLHHAHGLDCSGGVLASSCIQSEYGDILDIMGVDQGHLNAFHKERLGWLGYNLSPPLTEVLTEGTYSISPMESGGNNAKGLKILRGTDINTGQNSWYYLEYRQPVGFDTPLFQTGSYRYPENIENGIVFHKIIEGDANSSQLLDMNPDSISRAGLDLRDPALEVGQIYSDAEAGMTIAPLTNDANGITVSISFGGGNPPICTRANPTASLTPGQSDWVAAGTMVNYSVTITNNDSSACSNSSYALSASQPSGWSASFGSNALNLAPGTSTTTTLTVTSAASATDGFYTVGVTAASDSNSASSSVTYVVDNPANNSAPVAVNDSVSTAHNNPITIYLLNNDFDPDGDTLTVTSTSGVNGSAQINANGTITFTPPSGFSGTEQFSYSISDGNGASASASVNVNVAAAPSNNGAPVAVPDSVTIDSKSAVTIPVLINDWDPESDQITLVGATQGAKGSVSINANGTLTYIPAKRFKSSDSFSYSISDGEKIASATVSIQLQSDGGSGDGSGGGGKGNGKKR